MLKFTIRRLLTALPVLFIVVTLVFFMARVIPGDPALQILGPDADPADLEALREQLGLNDPLGVQYVEFLKGLVRGDWGNSLYNGKPVLENIFSRMEPTLLLANRNRIFPNSNNNSNWKIIILYELPGVCCVSRCSKRLSVCMVYRR